MPLCAASLFIDWGQIGIQDLILNSTELMTIRPYCGCIDTENLG